MVKENSSPDREAQLAMKVGAIFLFASVTVRIVSTFLAAQPIIAAGGSFGDVLTWKRVVFPFLEFLAGSALWNGNSKWRNTAVFIAVLNLIGLIVSILPAFLSGNFYGLFDLIGYTSLVVALAITVLGHSSRRRIWIGVAIFGIGYLGVFILAGISAFFASAFPG
ncbi:MAG: hypothetical protein HYR94_07580 [Chloroflexi bacterium]|nr:hypothetical protein [Chloroflexota bacterium]